MSFVPSRLTTKEILKQTKRIEIKTNRLVNDLFGGRYHSTFKGRGMEFSDIREYFPGDDIRDIHWNVTARMNKPFVKRFSEERELTILIALDMSSSLSFGSKSRFKSELAAELVSLIALSSLKNNDKIGLLLFTDQIEGFIPPRKSKSHVLRLIRDTLAFHPKGKGTDLNGALRYLDRVQKKRSVIFLVSDFLDTGYERALGSIRKRHDTIAFLLEDAMEKEWPAVGTVVLEDAENAGRRWVNLRKAPARSLFKKRMDAQREERERILAKNQIDRVVFSGNEGYVRPLMTFFKKRAARKRR